MIRRKYISPNAVSGDKILLRNHEALRAQAATGEAVSLLELNTQNKLEFLTLPRVSYSPVDAVDLANKGYVDQAVQTSNASVLQQLYALEMELDAEVLARQQADAAEAQARASEDTRLAGLIYAEEVRAMAEEQRLQGEIDAEESARMAADQEIDGRLDIIEGDYTVPGSIAKAKYDAISEVRGGASLAYDTLKKIEDKISFIMSNVDPAALDSLTEIVAAYQSADSDIYDAIMSLTTTIRAEIQAETTRAMAEEARLQGEIDAEEAARIAADYAESSARMQEDARLEGLIQAEEMRAMAEEQRLQGEIDAEKARAMAAEAAEAAARSAEDAQIRLDFAAADAYVLQQAKDYTDAEVAEEAALRAAEDLTFLKLDGSRPMMGDLDMGGYGIRDVDNIDAYKMYAEFIDLRTDSEGSRVVLDKEQIAFRYGGDENQLRASVAYSKDELKLKLYSRSGEISVLSSKLSDLADPTAAQDAATKFYTDGAISTASAADRAYTDMKIAAVIDSAPEMLDTLRELAEALGNDANFSVTVLNAISAERTRAMAEEARIEAKVDAERARALAAEAAEAAARIAADAAEASARAAADAAETAARIAADQAIEDMIAEEASVRLAADAAESAAREAADAEIRSDIEAEESARIVGDVSTLSEAKLYADSQLALLTIQVQAYESKTLSLASDLISISVASTIVGTPWVMIDGVMARPNVDFTVSGKVITFTGEWASTASLATGSPVELGDVVHVFYMKEFKPFE